MKQLEAQVPTTRHGSSWRGRPRRRPAYAGDGLRAGHDMRGADERAPQTALQTAPQLEPYPIGGLDEVIRRIAALVREGISSREIRELALNLTQHVTPDPSTGLPDRKRNDEIADVVYRFITSSVAYVHDPDGVESLESASYTLREAAGDCDAHAVLGMSLLGSLGIETRMVFVGTDPAHPKAVTHIYLDYKNERGQWVPFDTVLATYVGDAVPEAAVQVQRVVTLDEVAGADAIADLVGSVAGAPVMLMTLRGLDGLGGAAQVGGAQLAGTTKGPISTPDVQLQIEARSHDGRVPTGENFYLDVYVERAYEWFGTCDVNLYAKDAASGDTIASAFIDFNKLAAWETCEGRGRLSFPLGFQPAERQVVLEIYDDDYFDDQLLGASNPLYLTQQDTAPRDDLFDQIGAGAEEAIGTAKLALYVGLPIAGLFVLRPYIDDFMRSYRRRGDE